MQSLDGQVDTNFSEQIEWLQQLVEQPSYSRKKADVEKAANLIERKMKELGFHTTLHDGGKYAEHREYHSRALGDKELSLALIGHVDTVYRHEPNPEWKGDYWKEENGRISGPGVLDMKGGLSVIVFALQALRDDDSDRFAELKIRVLVNTDEEVGSPSSREVIESMSTYTTGALVFECGREKDEIVTKRKATGGFKLVVTGRPAHAGLNHEEGVNALHALSLIVPQIEGMTDYDSGLTLNVAIHHQYKAAAKNVVPGEVICSIDMRAENSESWEQAKQKLLQIADMPFNNLHDVPEVILQHSSVIIEQISNRPPMIPDKRSQQLRKEYESRAKKCGLGIGEAGLQGGGSDASLFSSFDVPSIDGLGPYGKGPHKPNIEWMEIENLKKRTKALARFLCEEAT